MKKIYDVAIIGSGPAGLTAAIYTTRGAASTVIFGGSAWGGQLMMTTHVDNFPTQPGIMGPELMQKMRDHAVMFGAEFVQESVESIDVSSNPFKLVANGQSLSARSIIIATGALTKWLEVPGEKALIGRGVSTCAPCDAPFFKNKIVAVVGGGDTAMEEAHYLTKYAAKIYLIHRRDEFKASALMQEKIKKDPKVEILWNTEVKEILGKDKVEGIKLLNNKDKKEKDLKLDGVFVAIGHKPNSDIFSGILEMDDKGYILGKEFHLKTSVPGVFVAGDVFDKNFKQAIVASGLGCVAAMQALQYLEEEK